MKEMIYIPDRVKTVLHTEEKDGYHIGIMSYGPFPCAYVSIPKDHPYYQKDFMDLDIWCHGGLTFSHPSNYCVPNEKKIRLPWAEGIEEECSWIGWDYAHIYDYRGDGSCEDPEPDRWTTQEILAECYEVIEQLKQVLKR